MKESSSGSEAPEQYASEMREKVLSIKHSHRFPENATVLHFFAAWNILYEITLFKLARFIDLHVITTHCKMVREELSYLIGRTLIITFIALFRT